MVPFAFLSQGNCAPSTLRRLRDHDKCCHQTIRGAQERYCRQKIADEIAKIMRPGVPGLTNALVTFSLLVIEKFTIRGQNVLESK